MLGFSVKRIFLRALSTFHPSLVSVRAVEGKGADALIKIHECHSFILKVLYSMHLCI
jgi:hypothetical protein